MRTLAALAVTGMREVLSQRLLYGVLVFAVGFTLASLALVHLTIGQWERLITDMGVSSIGIACSLMATLIGAALIAREMERKTLYFVLSKPLGRAQFVLGKFLGLALVLVLNAAAMLALIVLVLGSNAFLPTVQLLAAVWGCFLEALLMASIAIMFSALTTSTEAVIYSFAFFVLGHLVSQVDFVMKKASPVLRAIGEGLTGVVPNFELMNFKAHAVNLLPLAGRDVGYATVYALGYVTLFLVFAVAIFQRRDLK